MKYTKWSPDLAPNDFLFFVLGNIIPQSLEGVEKMGQHLLNTKVRIKKVILLLEEEEDECASLTIWLY